MTGRGGGGGRKTLLAPIHFIFSLLQQRKTVSVWLYEQLTIRIEGKIRVSPYHYLCNLRWPIASQFWSGVSCAEKILISRQGFDEFMNIVIDDAVEVKLATKDEAEKRRQLGKVIYIEQVPHKLILCRPNTTKR